MSNSADSFVATTPAPIQPMLLVASVAIGAVLGLALVLPIDPVISMPEELGSWPMNPTPEYVLRYNEAYSKMWMGNLAINFALIGVAAGTVTAILFARRTSLSSRLSMAALGLLGGALSGLATGFMVARAHSTQGRLDLFGWSLDPMLQSVFFHTICWSGIGMGIGVAVALGRQQAIGNGLAGGLLGGFAAGILHALIGSIAFPSSDVANLLPPSALERFLWVAYSSSAMAAGIWWVFRKPKPAPAT